MLSLLLQLTHKNLSTGHQPVSVQMCENKNHIYCNYYYFLLLTSFHCVGSGLSSLPFSIPNCCGIFNTSHPRVSLLSEHVRHLIYQPSIRREYAKPRFFLPGLKIHISKPFRILTMWYSRKQHFPQDSAEILTQERNLATLVTYKTNCVGSSSSPSI